MGIAKKVLSEYKVGKTIGEGAFSKVKIATHRRTGTYICMYMYVCVCVCVYMHGCNNSTKTETKVKVPRHGL